MIYNQTVTWTAFAILAMFLGEYDTRFICFTQKLPCTTHGISVPDQVVDLVQLPGMLAIRGTLKN